MGNVFGKPYWREEDGRVVVAALNASGLSAAEFAARHGVDARRVRSWRRRLMASGMSPSTSPAMAFLPVRVRDEAPRRAVVESGAIASHASPGASAIEVVVGRYTVRLPAGFDVDGLHQVLEELEARQC